MKYVCMIFACMLLFASCGNGKKYSLEQAIEDCENFDYLLRHRYGGYEVAVKNGFDFDKAILETKQKITEVCEKKKKISYSKLDDILYYTYFAINDHHFHLNGYPLSETKILQFTDIYVKKTPDGFEVVKSNDKNVKIGMNYTDDEANLFPYLSAGEDVYRVGTFSEEQKSISFDNKSRKCTLSKNTWIYAKSSDDIEIKNIEGDSFSYIHFSSFFGQRGHGAEFEEVSEDLRRAADKENFILDLRGNFGGFPDMADVLFYSSRDFNNNIFVLADKVSASASEDTIFKLKNNPKTVVIGENTCGAFTTGSPWEFYLPNSRIEVRLPTGLFSVGMSDYYNEGEGIMPDYWAFRGDVVDTLFALTGNEEIRDKLSVID